MSVGEQAARLASDLPGDLRERVSDELTMRLTDAAQLGQLELDGVEPAPTSPIWR